mgnify:CR=1 FL=1
MIHLSWITDIYINSSTLMNMNSHPSAFEPLRSIHTNNFPEILNHLSISLVVSTYQAGRLIMLRADGATLNTHFRTFNKPMGVATDRNRLAIGGQFQIWQLWNVPATTARLHPPGKHDACFLPRQTHITGDIDIHEMAYGEDELWFVNTRFSCLCTVDAAHSFIPRWRPPFVTAYEFSDRCHLNGLGMREGKPRYVTALGETDQRAGWRANKANGGILMDVQSNEILCRGLSMPHSPRWYDGKLWVLESGNGSLVRVDLGTGQRQTIVELPGFTRGLDFCGPLAFIGLSQVRETAVFSGLPITQRCQERISGVWVVNIYTGEIIAFMKFEDLIQEIFAVTVLPGIRFPELIDWDENLLSSSYVLPDQALKEIALPEPDPVVDSLAVVVPVWNIEPNFALCQQTFDSIQASLEHFQQQHPQASKIKFEVILVDDGSSDRSVALLTDYLKDKPHFRLVQHEVKRGQGAARNTGVKASEAKAICFCEVGALFRPEHLLMTVKLLNTPLDNSIQPLCPLPGNFAAAVKMGLVVEATIDPYWEKTLQQDLTLNLGIRREAHEFMEGFPLQEQFGDGDDSHAYHTWLTTLFAVIWDSSPTVELRRHPGNTLDRHFERFQSPPAVANNAPPPDSQIHQSIQEHLTYLQAKFASQPEIQRLMQLGMQSYQERQLEQAQELFRQCLSLQSGWTEAHYNLGVVFMEQGQHEAAIAEFEQVLTRPVFNPEAYNNLGLISQLRNQTHAAMNYYRQALNLRPGNADVHLNLALAHLQLGEFEAGLAEYEWRTQTPQVPQFDCPHPRWDGGEKLDQTLLIHTEQGSGDAIQFIRFVAQARQRVGRVILVCIPDLAALLGTASGVDEVRLPGDIPLNDFQSYISLMSLPLLLKTTLATLPQTVPYLQVPPAIDLPLPPRTGQKLRVGIVWAGNPTHKDNARRSCRLSDFRPVLKTTDIEFFCLQKVVSPAEQDQLDLWTITDLSGRLESFAHTAVAIAQLDLVITVDTSVAHLAGALGKPVWVLLCYSPDWRWMLERTDSPWYPTMRLFRQASPGDWAGVFAQVQQALVQLRDTN